MPTGNGESNSNSSPSSKQSPNMPDRQPFLKRSKTIAEGTRTGHFPGPLFPAVRRTSTSPPSESSTSTTNSFSSRSSSSSFSDHSFKFSDRDYVYPSFLGPYATRSRVTIKSKPKCQKNDESLGPLLPPTNASKRSNLSVDVGSLEEPAQRFGAPPPLPPPPKVELKPKPRLKSEKELNPLSIQISASSALSHVPNSSANFSPRRNTGLRSSWTSNLVSLFLIWSFFFLFFFFFPPLVYYCAIRLFKRISWEKLQRKILDHLFLIAGVSLNWK